MVLNTGVGAVGVEVGVVVAVVITEMGAVVVVDAGGVIVVVVDIVVMQVVTVGFLGIRCDSSSFISAVGSSWLSVDSS